MTTPSSMPNERREEERRPPKDKADHTLAENSDENLDGKLDQALEETFPTSDEDQVTLAFTRRAAAIGNRPGVVHAEQHEPRRKVILKSERSFRPQRLGCDLDGLPTYAFILRNHLGADQQDQCSYLNTQKHRNCRGEGAVNKLNLRHRRVVPR